MFASIVDSDSIEKSTIWSAQFFSKSQEDSPSSAFPVVCLRDVVDERRETVNPQIPPYSGFPYIGLESVESGTRTLLLSTIKRGIDVKSTSKTFKAGDVLYGRLRPNLNKVYLVDNEASYGLCTTEIVVLVPKKNILPEYLAEILLSDEVKQIATSLVRGASLPRVQVEDLLNIKIPLPDMKNQQDIVEFIKTHRSQWQQYRLLVDEMPQYIKDSLHSKLYENRPLYPMPALSS